MANRINTVMQTCFFAISGVLPRDEAIAQIKKAIEKTYGKRGEAVVQKNLRGRRQRPGPPPRGCRAGPGDAARSASPPAVPAEAPDVRPAGDGQDDRRPRRRPAGQRAAGRRHLPERAPPSGRSAPSPWTCRSGSRTSASSAASACMVCPHAVIRSKVYDAGARSTALRRRSSPRPPAGASCRTSSTRSRSAPTTAPAAPSASRSARPRTRATSAARRSTWRPSSRCAQAESEQLGLLPRPAGLPEGGRAGLDERQERPAPGAALRVLRRLRRLRRDAVPEAAQPALRRPRDDRQRDRLLQHLRRQPADDALDHQPRGARPGLEQLAVRGQRRVRARHAPDARQAGRVRPRAAAAAARRDRARARRRSARRRPVRRGRHRGPARARRGAEATTGRAWTTRPHATC